MEGKWNASGILKKLFSDGHIDDSTPWNEVFETYIHMWPGMFDILCNFMFSLTSLYKKFPKSETKKDTFRRKFKEAKDQSVNKNDVATGKI